MKFKSKGRLPIGTMNTTEAKYARLLEARKQCGEVLWYSFEAINLRLADATYYRPDFFVMLADGGLQVHEVKGHKRIFTDDAKVKIKVAAELYPFPFFVCYPRKGSGLGACGWDIEEV